MKAPRHLLLLIGAVTGAVIATAGIVRTPDAKPDRCA